MITEEPNKKHQKHTALSRPATGEFGRNEIAILGTDCGTIKKLAYRITEHLSAAYKIAYADADHSHAENTDVENIATSALSFGASAEFIDKIAFRRFDASSSFNSFQKRVLFNEQDLILINGNHFPGKTQIVVVDPKKSLEKKLDRLTNVKLILLKEKDIELPAYLKNLPGLDGIPILHIEEDEAITQFVQQFLEASIPLLQGLVLSGGLSTRMQKDKGSLEYHGKSQREYVYEMLSKYCKSTFISCNREQASTLSEFEIIEDSFLNLGPVGGILSALQSNPNVAWLTVACDLPYLSDKTIEYLVAHRNPSKMTTAFADPKGEFPEPLITIWEPKSYSILLQFLGQGYSCPRKALINSDIELLQAPDESEFQNVNRPEEYQAALQELKLLALKGAKST